MSESRMLLVIVIHSIWGGVGPRLPTILWTVTLDKNRSQWGYAPNPMHFLPLVDKHYLIDKTFLSAFLEREDCSVPLPLHNQMRVYQTSLPNTLWAVSRALSTRSWPLLQAAQVTSVTSYGKLKWHVVREPCGGGFWTHSMKQTAVWEYSLFWRKVTPWSAGDFSLADLN